jgi:hypothetical protein
MSTTTSKKPAAAAVAAVLDTRNWTINNQCTTTELVVIYCYTTDVTPSKFYYGQNRRMITPSATQKTIPAGIVSTVVVPDETKDTNGSAHDTTLILADAKTLFPVKLITFAAGTTSFADTAVQELDITNMSEAHDFCKNILCFPGSTLATDFTAALNDPTNPGQKVIDFFANSDGYTHVTLDMVHAISSYYTSLPYGWAGEAKSKTFWVYKGDHADATAAGKLEITNTWNMPLEVDPSGDFKATLKIDGASDKVLTFRDGSFIDNADSNTHPTALKGTFIVRSELTNNIAEDKIVPYLIGKVNMVDAFALDYEYTDKDAEDGGFYDIITPKNWKEGFDLFIYITSVGMGIMFIVEIVKFGIWLRKRRLPNESEAALNQRFEEIKSLIKGRTADMLSLIAPEQHFPTPQEIALAQQAAKARQLNDRVERSKARLDRVIRRQRGVMEALGRYGNTRELQQVGGELIELDGIQQMANADYLQNLADTITSMQECQTTLAARRTHLEYQLEQGIKDEIDGTLQESARYIDRFQEDIRERDAINDDFEFEPVER